METITYQKNKDGDLEKTVVVVISKDEIAQKSARIEELRGKIKAHQEQCTSDCAPYLKEIEELSVDITGAEEHGVVSTAEAGSEEII